MANTKLTKEDFRKQLSRSSNLSPWDCLLIVAKKASKKYVSNAARCSRKHRSPSPPREGRRRANPKTPIRQQDTSPLPPIFLEKIADLGGSRYEPRLLFQKELYASDVDVVQYRLSMPVSQCNEIEFRDDEVIQVTEKDLDQKYNGLEVDVIQPANGHEITKLKLKKYVMRGIHSYMFSGRRWNGLVKDNGLVENDKIQVWHFRLNNIKSDLCFAIVKLN